MKTRDFLTVSVFLLGANVTSANTVRAPLVTYISDSSGARWFTETRLWNMGTETAHVQITDVIGFAPVLPILQTIPPGAVLEVPWYVFVDPRRSASQNFTALVEFTSDQPLRADTVLGTYMVPAADCNIPGTAGPPPVLPYYGGGDCVPMTGPLLKGLATYLAPGKPGYTLDWLTSDVAAFRTSLFLINPNASSLNISVLVRSADGTQTGDVQYTIPAHTMVVVRDFFLEPQMQKVAAENAGRQQGAATAQIGADQPFYAYAIAINNSIYGKGSTDRFVVAQPESAP